MLWKTKNERKAMEDIILVGFGGHAKSVADSIRREGKFHIVGYTEKAPVLGYCEYQYLGNDNVLEEYYKEGIENVFIGLGYMGNGEIRDTLAEELAQIGFKCPSVIDPSAVISSDAEIEEGTFIGKNAVVNAGAKIGKQCIINTGAVVEHECLIRDFSHIAVNATLCGNVYVEDHCFIGANSTVIQGIKVCNHSIIGAGSIILGEVPPYRKVYGVWKKEE